MALGYLPSPLTLSMVKAQQVMERLEDKHQKARAEKRTAWDLNA